MQHSAPSLTRGRMAVGRCTARTHPGPAIAGTRLKVTDLVIQAATDILSRFLKRNTDGRCLWKITEGHRSIAKREVSFLSKANTRQFAANFIQKNAKYPTSHFKQSHYLYDLPPGGLMYCQTNLRTEGSSFNRQVKTPGGILH